jgi:hypothetical protein
VLPAVVGLAGFLRRRGRSDDASAALDEVVTALDAAESVGDIQEFHVELVVELLEAVAGRRPRASSADARRALAGRVSLTGRRRGRAGGRHARVDGDGTDRAPTFASGQQERWPRREG